MKGCIVATTEVSIRRSNKDVARAMLISGIALVVVAAALDFFAVNIVDFINGLGAPLHDFIYRLWSLVIRLGYALGPFLIVDAIIVNRLPETASKHD